MDAASREALVASIYNAAWWVRYYRRPGQGAERDRALHELGLAARAAFNSSEDFEPLLRALVDALSPREPTF